MAPLSVSGAEIFRALLVIRSRSCRSARIKDSSLYHEDVRPAGFQYTDDESSETAVKAPFIPIARVPTPVANPESANAPLMEESDFATGQMARHRTKYTRHNMQAIFDFRFPICDLEIEDPKSKIDGLLIVSPLLELDLAGL